MAAEGAGRQVGRQRGSPTATAGAPQGEGCTRQEKRKAGKEGVQVRQSKALQQQRAGGRSKESKGATREDVAEARHRGRYHEPGD